MAELYRASAVVLELPYSAGATAPLALAAAALRARFAATQEDEAAASISGANPLVEQDFMAKAKTG
jgi:hypothetical protein